MSNAAQPSNPPAVNTNTTATATNNNVNTAIPMTSLYVGDLHPDVTEAMLYEKFSSVGPVLSIRVCRDMVSRKSLGYAYVNFQTAAHAELAMDNMNFDKLRGRPIRIMWSQRDPALRKSGHGNIFIKNIDKSVEQKQFYDTFFAFGNILSCKIAVDESGKSKGYGFVHYELHDSAKAAIDNINGMLIENKQVFVGPFIPRSQRPGSESHLKFTNVFIKNFGDEFNDETLKEKFSEVGEIVSAKVMLDANNKSKGFGFVCFKEAKAAEEAVTRFNNTQVGGGGDDGGIEKTIFVGRAQKKAERNEELKRRHDKQRNERTSRYATGVNLYVKNMDDTLTDDLLKKEFEQFGTITSAKVMLDANNKSKGFGFVCFANPEQATKAVTEMNGKICGSKPLYVALAQRKEDRQAHLTTQFMQRVAQYRQHPNGLAGLGAAAGGGGGMMQPNYMAAAAAAGMGVPPPPGAHPAAMHQHFSSQLAAAVAANNPNNAAALRYAQMNPAMAVSSQFFNAGHSHRAVAGGGGVANPGMAAALGNYPGQFNSPAAARWTSGGPANAGIAGVMQQSQTQQQQQQAFFAAQQQQQQQQRQQHQNFMAGNQQAQQQSYAASAAAANSMQDPAMMQQLRGAPANFMALQQQQQQQQQGRPITGGAANPRGGSTAAASVATANRNGGVAAAAQGKRDEKEASLTEYSKLSIDEHNQLLGERLFPFVQKKNPENAGKITGMLLGIDHGELILLLEDEAQLNQRIDEAIKVFNQHKSGGVAASNKDLASSDKAAAKPSASGDSVEAVATLKKE